VPRVLLLLEYPTLFGGERSLLSSLESVVDAGWEPVAAVPEQGPLADCLRKRDVPVLPHHLRDAAARRLPPPQARRQLSRLLHAAQPTLVHANSLAMGRLIGPVSDEHSLPSIAHLRDILRVSAAAMRDLNRNGCLLAVSQATADFHVAAGLDAAKTKVIYNGVDLARFQPRAATGYLHRERGIAADCPLVAAIGQIGLRKGLDTFLAAAAMIAPELPKTHFLIVGERYSDKEESRRYERRLRQVAGSAALTGRVHFLGMRDDVPQLLNELTLLMHCARQEPLGRVLLEAAASGVPVVATDVGGTGEIFPAGQNLASLVEPDDPAAVAQQAKFLFADPAEAQRRAGAARQRIEQHFDARQAGDQLAAHYAAVTSETS